MKDKPDSSSEALFIHAIKAIDEQRKSRCNGCLEHAQEKSYGEKRGEVLSCRHAGENGAPNDHVCAGVFGKRKILEHASSRELPDDIADVFRIKLLSV